MPPSAVLSGVRLVEWQFLVNPIWDIHVATCKLSGAALWCRRSGALAPGELLILNDNVCRIHLLSVTVGITTCLDTVCDCDLGAFT